MDFMKVQQKSIEQYIEDLKESKQLGSLLLDNADEALFFYSMEGKLIYVSPAFEKITGYTTQELYEKNFIPYVHPDDQEWTIKLYQGLFKGEFFEDVEYRIVKKDGEIRWSSSSWKIVFDNDGRQIGLQGKQQDITDHKQAEEALQKSERKYRYLFDNMTEGFALCEIICDEKGIPCNYRVLDVNKAYEEQTGTEASAIVGKTVLEFYPDIEKSWIEIYGEIALTKKPRTFINYNHNTDKYYETSAFALEKGQFALLFNDITERKQVEKALHRSEVLERLATGSSLNEILIALVSNAEKYNPEILCSVMLLDEGGKHLRTCAAPNLPDFFTDAIDGMEIGHEMVSCGEAAFTGKRVIVEDIMSHPNWVAYRKLARKANLRACWSEPVISSTGDILGTFAIYNCESCGPSQSDLDFIRDSARLAAIAIERKQAEEALMASEQKFKSVVENIGIGVSLISPDMKILALNKQMKAWFPDIDVTKRPVCYRSFNNPPRETKCSYCQTKKTLVDGQVYEVVTETPAGDKILNYRIVSSPIKDENGKVIAAIDMFEDITERKQAEETTLNLLQQNRDLTQRLFHAQEEERRHLARELHDEFGQWLTAIHLNTEIISQLSEGQNEGIYATAQVINESASEMYKTIHGMIRQLRPTLLDELGLVESLKHLVEQWQSQYPEADITLSLDGELDDFEDNINITIYRIIQESLTNVAKYAQARNAAVQLIRQPGEAGAQESLLLTVEDNGKGMDTEALTEGFGLAGMRERVLAVGGKFNIHSSPEKGVRIEIWLPVKQQKNN